ncbi:MAG: hypothetical protein KBF37_09165 [Saprospiraceae bacterium]|jgi:hypothetical protein|nr:hypothetical protein [Saprospiraceae bacterium]MBP9210475.1 hypothetical protein [Saprospiraceae bacterium]
MCTANSLERFWPSSRALSSLWSVLVFGFVWIVQDRSGALYGRPASMAVTVQAPADITIHLQDPTNCDTTILLGPAIFNGHCPGPIDYETWSVFDTLFSNGGNMYFPAGSFTVYYKVSDACRMSGLDSMRVTVYDAQLPQVVCAPAQTINLSESGYADVPAHIFDGGSTDNCHHLYFKIRRMMASTALACQDPLNPLNLFNDYARFCCADADSSGILLVLRVYDVFPGEGVVSDTAGKGRYVDCMVTAIVRDKLAPSVECPPDHTVFCGTDADDLFAGGSPLISDNCGIATVDTAFLDLRDPCGGGEYRRTFTVTDRHGLVTHCTQTLHYLRLHTFDGTDTAQLRWPSHKTVYACRIDLDSIQAGAPVIVEDGCALVVVTKRDEVYQFSMGGVCAKVLRYWQVIDWCRYDPLFTPNPRIPENGYYAFVQEIKVIDTLPPQIFGVQDTVIGIQVPGCGPGLVNLPPVQAEDCGSTTALTFRYEVDYDHNGVTDRSGTGRDASGLFPPGRHLVWFFAVDSCHNEGSLQVLVEVVDAKAPNAIAMYGVSSSLAQMPAGAMVSVTARLFNNKSNDNCTQANRLRYSFSEDVSDTLRIYTCDSLGRRDIRLVVWDEAGNSSEVYTYFVVDDPDSLCPGGLHGLRIQGIVATGNWQAVPEVDVSLESSGMALKVQSDAQGNFMFANIPAGSDIQIRSSRSGTYTAGLTTADIIRIQRQLLGLEPFSHSWEYLAADVDMSGGISTRDIVYLRRLLLGKIQELPHQHSYLFIDPSYTFSDPASPYADLDLCSKVVITQARQNETVRMLAIKIGDVNQSYRANGLTEVPYETIRFFAERSERRMGVFISQPVSIRGFQMSLSASGLCKDWITGLISALPEWSNEHYRLEGSEIVISYSSPGILHWDPSVPLFEIQLKEDAAFCAGELQLSNVLDPECYLVDAARTISLLQKDAQSASPPFSWVRTHSDPGTGMHVVHLYTASASDVDVQIYDLNQRTISAATRPLQQGLNELIFFREQFGPSGMYLLRISSGNHSVCRKLLAF